jgi:Tol biopolymer transport system component
LLCLASAAALRAQAPEERVDSALFVFEPESIRVAEVGAPIHPRLAPSANGRFFAALQTRPDPVLWIVPSDGGEPFAYRKTWAAYHPRWAPSGDRIGFIAGIGPPRIWTIEVDPETGRPTAPPRMLYRTPANAFAFSPDGARVAFVPRRSTAAGASEIYIVDWKTRRVKLLLREKGMIYRLDWAPSGEHIFYGLAPTDLAGDTTQRIVRVRVASRKTATVLRTAEFLGLSRDGAFLLHRPADPEFVHDDILEIVKVNGELLLRVAIREGAAPVWGVTSGTLVQVHPGEQADEIWLIPTCPLCSFTAW